MNDGNLLGINNFLVNSERYVQTDYKGLYGRNEINGKVMTFGASIIYFSVNPRAFLIIIILFRPVNFVGSF